MLYHVPENSFYIQIVRIRYSCEEYFKAHIRYFYKTSGNQFAEERSVKISRKVMKRWSVL